MSHSRVCGGKLFANFVSRTVMSSSRVECNKYLLTNISRTTNTSNVQNKVGHQLNLTQGFNRPDGLLNLCKVGSTQHGSSTFNGIRYYSKLKDHVGLAGVQSIKNNMLTSYSKLGVTTGLTNLNSIRKQVVENVQNSKKFQMVKAALQLHLESMWQRHSVKIVVGGMFVMSITLWKVLYASADLLFQFDERSTEIGFLALSIALTSLALIYFRNLHTLSPDSVYRKALLKLNTSPGILEVLGAPLIGSDVRAFVVRGGGMTLNNFVPKFHSKKLNMMFPIAGSTHKGIVSLEAIKKNGHYSIKLLAVDVPSMSGPAQRLYLEGDENLFNKGGLLDKLRDPFFKATSLKDDDEMEDLMEERANK